MGDVSGDGVLSFLDIAPFIALISNSLFLPEADIDGNGEVNFLDIAPFINLLNSWSDCPLRVTSLNYARYLKLAHTVGRPFGRSAFSKRKSPTLVVMYSLIRETPTSSAYSFYETAASNARS